VDATFREERQRQAFLGAAVRWGVPAVVLLCQAGPETVRRRLKTRRGDASDADWPVYLQVAASWEEPGPATCQVLHPVSTEGGREQALSRAIEAVRQSGLWRVSSRADQPSAPVPS
jgi:predicted kinase